MLLENMDKEIPIAFNLTTSFTEIRATSYSQT